MQRFIAFTIVCLTLGFGIIFLGEDVHAIEKEEKRVNKDTQNVSNITVKATISPSSVTLDTMEQQAFTVKSNVPGSNSFKFNPGDGRGWSRAKYGDYSRKFYYFWDKIGTYRYQGSVTNNYYGPGIIDTGTAIIVLK